MLSAEEFLSLSLLLRSVKCKIPSFRENDSSKRNDEEENYNVRESFEPLILISFISSERLVRRCLLTSFFLFNNLWWSVMTIMMSLLWVYEWKMRRTKGWRSFEEEGEADRPPVEFSKHFMLKINLQSLRRRLCKKRRDNWNSLVLQGSISKKNKGNSKLWIYFIMGNFTTG